MSSSSTSNDLGSDFFPLELTLSVALVATGTFFSVFFLAPLSKNE